MRKGPLIAYLTALVILGGALIWGIANSGSGC